MKKESTHGEGTLAVEPSERFSLRRQSPESDGCSNKGPGDVDGRWVPSYEEPGLAGRGDSVWKARGSQEGL